MNSVGWWSTLLKGALVLVVLPLVLQELQECSPWLANKLIEWAVALLPEADRELYEAEWRGELASVPGKLVKLVRATGLVIAALRIRGPLRDPRQARVRRKQDLGLLIQVHVEVRAGATLTLRRPKVLVAFALVGALALSTLWLENRPAVPHASPGNVVNYDGPNDNSNIGKYIPPGHYWQEDFVARSTLLTGGWVLLGANTDGGDHRVSIGIYTGSGHTGKVADVIVPVAGYDGESFKFPSPIHIKPGQTLYLTVVGIGDSTVYDNRAGFMIARVIGTDG